jgi:hypothetical protein
MQNGKVNYLLFNMKFLETKERKELLLANIGIILKKAPMFVPGVKIYCFPLKQNLIHTAAGLHLIKLLKVQSFMKKIIASA